MHIVHVFYTTELNHYPNWDFCIFLKNTRAKWKYIFMVINFVPKMLSEPRILLLINDFLRK